MWLIPLKKKKYYDFETKFQVIIAKEKGMSNKEIQQKFQIVAVQQIYRWVKWFKERKFFHLQQQIGHNYTYKKIIFYGNKKTKNYKSLKKN
ncbi:hypothetical protein RS022_00840 [Candidatus Phytoplasma rubi]|uniref:Insertion element IS150 protein InsJ-like helix-turn-helix domain-containing protein n=1 Tax=Candidatus Phytoplasma rubi TaxID=399025 RepID=A0ABY7BRL6_9MOLU|nr:transposase [Candidatus Phytoplasma rubi]WAN63093.1 hypothetical protein RS022_00840 [Candidatus Phytoplasma rubi]